MRKRMWLVAMGLMVGCGSAERVPATPVHAAVAPAPQRRIDLPGWPSIEVEALSSATERSLAIVTAGYATLPAATERDAGAWRTWIRAEADSIQVLGTLARQPGPTPDRAVRVALVAAYMEAQFFAMSRADPNVLRGPRGEQPRSSRDSILRSCAGLGVANEALHPWAARCASLSLYWQAWDAWRTGPVWPEGCEHTARPVSDISDETSLGRPAVVFGVESDLSPADEQRLSLAVQRVMRAHLPEVDVISPREVAAAERAHALMQGLDGASCAWPPSVNTRLARAHPRLWSVTTYVHCADTIPGPTPQPGGPCRLSISTSAISGSAEGAPVTLQVGLGIANASAQDFESALTRLAPETPNPLLAGISGSFGITGRSFREGTHLESTTNYDPSDAIEVALRRASPAVHACRDLDASVPSGIGARLHIAPTGAVLDVRIEGMTGPERIACVERALRAVQFPTSASAQDLQVRGAFGLNTPTTTHTRVHAEDRYASWAVSDPRVLERIQACTSEPAVRVVNASVHVTQSGVASHVQSDASDATTTCLQNALIGSVWPCSGERDVAMRLCVGDPVAPPEPVRP